MSIIPEHKSPAEYAGGVIANLLFNLLLSYWFLLTLNYLLDKNYPYTLPYLASAYFVVTFTKYILKK